MPRNWIMCSISMRPVVRRCEEALDELVRLVVLEERPVHRFSPDDPERLSVRPGLDIEHSHVHDDLARLVVRLGLELHAHPAVALIATLEASRHHGVGEREEAARRPRLWPSRSTLAGEPGTGPPGGHVPVPASVFGVVHGHVVSGDRLRDGTTAPPTRSQRTTSWPAESRRSSRTSADRSAGAHLMACRVHECRAMAAVVRLPCLLTRPAATGLHPCQRPSSEPASRRRKATNFASAGASPCPRTAPPGPAPDRRPAQQRGPSGTGPGHRGTAVHWSKRDGMARALLHGRFPRPFRAGAPARVQNVLIWETGSVTDPSGRPYRSAVSAAQRFRHGLWACPGPGWFSGRPPVRCSRSARGGPGAVGRHASETSARVPHGAYPSAICGVPPASVVGQRVGGVTRHEVGDQFGSERAEPLDLLHALDGVAGSRARSAAPSAAHSELPRRPLAGTHSYGPEDGGPGPGSVAGGTRRPRRGGRSAQRAAGRPARCAGAACASTDHAAAS